MEKDLNALTEKIEVWARDRELDSADVTKQALKLVEEVGELCEGLVKEKGTQVVDSIGDIFVVLTIMSLQLGLSIQDCVAAAYDEIKDRKGATVNGSFIKESDLAY